MGAQGLCLGRQILPGRGLGHVGGLRQFHLDGVIAFVRPPVMTRGPSAFKSAIEDRAIAIGSFAMGKDTRQFARRQRTWLRAIDAVEWFDPRDERAVLERVARFVGA